jgi:hypothetical protein
MGEKNRGYGDIAMISEVRIQHTLQLCREFVPHLTSLARNLGVKVWVLNLGLLLSLYDSKFHLPHCVFMFLIPKEFKLGVY